MYRRLHALLVILTFLPPALCFTPLTETAARSLEVNLTDNRLSLKADHHPLHQILFQLSAYGITLQIDPVINPPISLVLDNEPVERGLQALLAKVNHVVTWEKTVEHQFQPVNIQIFTPGHRDRMEELVPKNSYTTIRHSVSGALLIKGELLLRLKDGSREQDLLDLAAELGGLILEKHNESGIYRLSFPPDNDIDHILRSFRSAAVIDTAEPHYAISRLPSTYLSPEIMAAIPSQEPTIGSTAIAVLDSGLSADGANSPWAVSFYDAVVSTAQPSDTSGHGTQMAMLASGAVNPLGSDQAAQSLSPVIAVRVFDDNGITSNLSLIKAIDFARDSGARVLSMSWGTRTPSVFLEKAVDRAVKGNDMILVAAAGNEPTGEEVYPAAYANVIGIGALQPDGSLWDSSNFGQSVDLSAPGFALFTQKGGETRLYAGTSISTAYMAKTIAEYLNTHPNATLDDIRQIFR